MLLLLGCQDHLFTLDGTRDSPEDTAADSGTPVDSGRTDPWPEDSGEAPTDDSATDTDTEEPRTDCESILVYSTAGTRGANTGLFDDLETDPTLSRWDVDVKERVSAGELTAASLMGRSQLWILGTDPDAGTTLGMSEVLVVRDFVEAGGGLLLAGGAAGSDSYAEDVNLLSELYGVGFDGSSREGTDGAPLTVEDADRALIPGVSSVPGFASVAELDVTDPAVQVAFTLGGGPSMAWRDDGVRVVFDRTWGGWQDAFRAVGDQSTLILDVATFLEPCPG